METLAFAAREEKPEVVSMFLEAGAEVDPQDAFGNTPLWRAVMSNKGNAVVELLTAAGADWCRKNSSGVSPSDLKATLGK